MASNSQTQNYGGLGAVTVAVDAWLESETDATVVLCVQTRIWGSWDGPWGFGIVGQSGYEGNGSNYAEAGRGWLNYTNTVVNGTCRWTVPKTQNGWTASCWAKAWGETVSGYGAYPLSYDVRCSVWIPARTRTPHGNPTMSASKTIANYGESVTLSWAKSPSQGNANFERFELSQGNSLIYSGSAISKSVVPSDYSGAQGGDVIFKLKEVHEWYGTYPSTETTVTVNVRSGVVTVYDSSGNKHTGLVTAYDSSGNAHYVLISAYDSSGAKHSVV